MPVNSDLPLDLGHYDSMISVVDARGSARQDFRASEERRPYGSRAKGAVQRNEETVGSEKEGGGEGEGGLFHATAAAPVRVKKRRLIFIPFLPDHAYRRGEGR
jgi:hypothetical protein